MTIVRRNFRATVAASRFRSADLERLIPCILFSVYGLIFRCIFVAILISRLTKSFNSLSFLFITHLPVFPTFFLLFYFFSFLFLQKNFLSAIA